MKKVAILTIALLLTACSLSARLTSGGRMFGRVTTLFDEPLPGSSISIEAVGGAHRAVATAGRDGRFRFGRTPPGSYRVSVSLSGFGTENLILQVLPGEPTLFEIGLRFIDSGDWEPCHLSGHVVDQHRKRVAGASVVAVATLNSSIKYATKTGADGQYSLYVFHPGYYVAIAHGPGYFPGVTATECPDSPVIEISEDFELRQAPR